MGAVSQGVEATRDISCFVRKSLHCIADMPLDGTRKDALLCLLVLLISSVRADMLQ
jgi:hypothetical protein